MGYAVTYSMTPPELAFVFLADLHPCKTPTPTQAPTPACGYPKKGQLTRIMFFGLFQAKLRIQTDKTDSQRNVYPKTAWP